MCFNAWLSAGFPQRGERRREDGEHQTAVEVSVGDEPELCGHPGLGAEHPGGAGAGSEQVPSSCRQSLWMLEWWFVVRGCKQRPNYAAYLEIYIIFPFRFMESEVKSHNSGTVQSPSSCQTRWHNEYLDQSSRRRTNTVHVK